MRAAVGLIWDNAGMYTNLLGGLSPRQFLSEYWQKKPLLVRQAVPGFTGLVDHDDLLEMACDPDVESRLVRRHSNEWELQRGPQKRSKLRGAKHPWTVLVQGVNLWVPAADALLHKFDFIPQARLDDLMVSYAVDGGGVGPHFDNYDVFLLQGAGKRRWRIGAQDDRSLLDDVPLKILKNFKPEFDWVLEPGDMLYLPPHWAHDGVAIGECTTYSIGFRSPDAQELGSEFLGWMQDRLKLDGLYADPDLEPQENSALIGDRMIDQVMTMLAAIRWDRADVAAFLGHYLTEPKPQVYFEPPEQPLTQRKFLSAARKLGLALDARSLLLCAESHFYLNGELLTIEPDDSTTLAALADKRRLPRDIELSDTLANLLYEAYCDGFVHPDEAP